MTAQEISVRRRHPDTDTKSSTTTQMRLDRPAVQQLRHTAARQALIAYSAVAAIAAGADLLTKQAAVSMLGDRVIPLLDRLSLMLVWNTGSAGGVMVGPYTWQLNVITTVMALVLITSVASALIAVDRRATLALGLIAGGAIGNLASMLAGPEGVADFLALQLSSELTIVMNVADLALWLGALSLAPVVVTLVRAIRAERRSSAVLVKA
jgi:signal peptidase II